MLNSLTQFTALTSAASAAGGAIFVKYMAAALVASQGSLIATYGIRAGGSARNVCSVVALIHYIVAAFVVYWAATT